MKTRYICEILCTRWQQRIIFIMVLYFLHWTAKIFVSIPNERTVNKYFHSWANHMGRKPNVKCQSYMFYCTFNSHLPWGTSSSGKLVWDSSHLPVPLHHTSSQAVGTKSSDIYSITFKYLLYDLKNMYISEQEGKMDQWDYHPSWYDPMGHFQCQYVTLLFLERPYYHHVFPFGVHKFLYIAESCISIINIIRMSVQ